MAQNKDEVLKQGLMVKRSQNKKRFTSVNYKQRWFVLTTNYLTYYDGDSTEVCPFSLNLAMLAFWNDSELVLDGRGRFYLLYICSS